MQVYPVWACISKIVYIYVMRDTERVLPSLNVQCMNPL